LIYEKQFVSYEKELTMQTSPKKNPETLDLERRKRIGLLASCVGAGMILLTLTAFPIFIAAKVSSCVFSIVPPNYDLDIFGPATGWQIALHMHQFIGFIGLAIVIATIFVAGYVQLGDHSWLKILSTIISIIYVIVLFGWMTSLMARCGQYGPISVARSIGFFVAMVGAIAMGIGNILLFKPAPSYYRFY
jgi:hypothetical protein